MLPSVQPKTRYFPCTAGVENILPGNFFVHSRLPSLTLTQRTLPEAVVYQARFPFLAKPATILLSSFSFQTSLTGLSPLTS